MCLNETYSTVLAYNICLKGFLLRMVFKQEYVTMAFQLSFKCANESVTANKEVLKLKGTH
jgi:hypothetical protein